MSEDHEDLRYSEQERKGRKKIPMLRGEIIASPDRPIQIEGLAIGDVVITGNGEVRFIDCRMSSDHPITIHGSIRYTATDCTDIKIEDEE